MASYIYVPGLALPGASPATAVTTAAAFRDKIRESFGMNVTNVRAVQVDAYMVGMIEVLTGKGATPVDCSRSLRWVQISGLGQPVRKRADVGKAMQLLGSRAGNVLARAEGVKPEPMATYLRGHENDPVCSAPEWLAQPQPSIRDNPAGPLAAVAAGDTLYIVGHSGVNGGALSYKYPPGAVHVIAKYRGDPGCNATDHSNKGHIDPAVLASLLVSEGLRPGIAFEIAVVACFSGGVAVDAMQTVQPFAQRLSGMLAARGFRCRVYGAMGLTLTKAGEVNVAESAERRGRRIELDDASAKPKPDAEDGQPFYRRFFRMFG